MNQDTAIQPTSAPEDAGTVPREHSTGDTENRAILKNRAQQMAKTVSTEARETNLTQILECRLGTEHYAFESSYVREVFPVTEITQLPHVPEHVMGVVNVRGRILSVMDIRRFLGLSSSGLTNLNRAIVLKHNDMEFAVLADSVTGVRSVNLDAQQRSLPTSAGRSVEYLRGVTQDRVAVLDAKKLLTSSEVIVDIEP